MRMMRWVGAAKKALEGLPKAVRREVADLLLIVACGKSPVYERLLKGFGSSKVRELRVDNQGNTYRVVLLLEIDGLLYVVDVFAKKSHRGGEVPKEINDRVWKRIRAIRAEHEKEGRKHGKR